MADGKYWLTHDAQDIDDTIDEVQAARGSEASLSARLADIVNDFEADQQRQDDAIATKITMEDILGAGRKITDTAGQDALDVGKFYCASTADAANISTPPWNSGYFGFTMRSVSTSQRFVQIAIQNDDDFHLAKRRYTGSWQPWAYITGTALASTQSSPASLMQAGRIDSELTDTGTGEEDEER